MAWVPSPLTLAGLILVQLLAFSLFLKGFFPIKTSLPGYATQGPSEPNGAPSEPNNGPSLNASFDRLVFVLIDALRADFVLPNLAENNRPQMKSVSDLIRNNQALGLQSYAHPPTVTMPRIKALTSGSIPGFVDVVLNYRSSELSEDNLVTQLHRDGQRVVFYGDDTWIRLFPGHFTRHDGTTSFYVTDYTEVDNNVTTHVMSELARTDWDVMVLHYLGLDHIGHLAGPHSALVPTKLSEMDQIVKHIYTSLLTKDATEGRRSLVVLCGDHGMTEQGNHGGASYSETSTPLVLLSPLINTASLHAPECEQIDIVPTLSLLLGLPIPQNNLGVLIPPAFSHLSPRSVLAATYTNARQLAALYKQSVSSWEQDPCYLLYQRATDLHRTWLESPNSHLTDKLLSQYRDSMVQMRHTLSRHLTTYDLHAMYSALSVLWMVLVGLLSGSLSHNWSQTHSVLFFIVFIPSSITHLAVCTSNSASPLLCSPHPVSLAAGLGIVVFTSIWCSCFVVAILKRNFYSSLQLKEVCGGWLGVLLVCGTLLHTLSLLSSSFVEEEHQTWYFLTVSIFVFKLTCQSFTSSATRGMSSGASPRPLASDWLSLLMLLILCRVAREWNRTGDKWSHLPDVGDWLVRPENTVTLSLLCGASLVVCGWMLTSSSQSVYGRGLVWVGVGGVYVFRAAQGSLSLPYVSPLFSSKGIVEARLVYTIILLILARTLTTFFTNKPHSYKKPTNDTAGQLEYSSKNGKKQASALSKSLHTCCILLSLLLLRPHNVCLVAMTMSQQVILSRLLKSSNIITSSLLYMWMGQAAFFYQGNSGSISSVDISAGFIGVSDYQPAIHGLLMAVSTYAGPISWYLAFICHVTANHSDARLVEVSSLLTVCRSLCLAVFALLSTSQRYHLFVWTVFSPKLLYEGMHSLVLAALLIPTLIYTQCTSMK